MSNYLTPYGGMTALEALAHDLKRPVEVFEQPLGLRNLVDHLQRKVAHTMGVPQRLLYGYYDPPVVHYPRLLGITILDEAWRLMIGVPKGSRGWRRHERRRKAKARSSK